MLLNIHLPGGLSIEPGKPPRWIKCFRIRPAGLFCNVVHKSSAATGRERCSSFRSCRVRLRSRETWDRTGPLCNFARSHSFVLLRVMFDFDLGIWVRGPKRVVSCRRLWPAGVSIENPVRCWISNIAG